MDLSRQTERSVPGEKTGWPFQARAGLCLCIIVMYQFLVRFCTNYWYKPWTDRTGTFACPGASFLSCHPGRLQGESSAPLQQLGTRYRRRPAARRLAAAASSSTRPAGSWSITAAARSLLLSEVAIPGPGTAALCFWQQPPPGSKFCRTAPNDTEL